MVSAASRVVKADIGRNPLCKGSWGAVLDNEAMSLTTSWTKQYGGAYRFGGFFSVSVVCLVLMEVLDLTLKLDHHACMS